MPSWLRPSASRPELVAFVPTAVVAAVSGALGHRRTHAVSKSLVVPVLQAGLAARRQTGWLLLAARGAGWCGDVLLLPPDGDESAADERRRLRRGAVAFGIQQIGYCTLMWRAGVRPTAWRAAVVIAGLGALSALDTVKGDGAPDAVITAYGVLLGAMTTLAWSSGSAQLRAGGLLFLASDAMILVREVLLRNPAGRAIAEAFVLGTYASAQALLVAGLVPPQQVAVTWK